MADRENVITQLKIISTWASFARGHDLQFFTEKHFEDMEQWANDAIAMLKEDCHNCKLECLLQKYDELKEKYDAMLKEKEAVEPCKDIARNRRCPNCYAILKGKFCHECGQAVKWDV